MDDSVPGISEAFYEAARGREQDLADACENVKALVDSIAKLSVDLDSLKAKQERGEVMPAAILQEIETMEARHRDLRKTLKIFELRVRSLGG